MKTLFKVLLLVVMFALQKSQEAAFDSTTEPISEDYFFRDIFGPYVRDMSVQEEYDDVLIQLDDEESVENVAVPNITVYQQMEDREHDRVVVVCMFDRMFNSWHMQSFELSVQSELNYTMEPGHCTSVDTRQTFVYMVTVSPPASFTCEHEVHSNGDVKNLRSQTYIYKRSVFMMDHHEEGVSLFYICFSSFIAVGLFIMTVAVIVTTIRSKAKDSVMNPTTVTDNDYMDA